MITRCESHTANVPLHALSRMLRAMFGIGRLDGATARAHIAAQLTDVVEAGSDDSFVLFDLLAIGHPDTIAPSMSADARRHRLIEVMGKVARPGRHGRCLPWRTFIGSMRPVKKSLRSSRKPSPRHSRCSCAPTGLNTRARCANCPKPRSELAPLDYATSIALIAGILGQRPTAADLAAHIAQPAAGNPFFVEEIVRDLVGRGLLLGNRGAYRLSGDLDTIAVPATVQSALAARIDRLTIAEKSILNAAAVIGSTFDLDVLHALLPVVESGDLRISRISGAHRPDPVSA